MREQSSTNTRQQEAAFNILTGSHVHIYCEQIHFARHHSQASSLSTGPSQSNRCGWSNSVFAHACWLWSVVCACLLWLVRWLVGQMRICVEVYELHRIIRACSDQSLNMLQTVYNSVVLMCHVYL